MQDVTKHHSSMIEQLLKLKLLVMKKILLSATLSFALLTGFAQTTVPSCVSEYKINNGGGSCPPIGQEGFNPTGTITLTFDFAVTANNIPTVVKAVNVTDPNNPIDVTGVLFGTGDLANNGKVTYCYYIGPANNNNLQGQNDVFEFVITYQGPNGQTITCGTEEIPLPVKFSAFTATRSNASSVSITWTTATEQNSKGFYVQKNVAGVWTNVAFVFSQAQNGTSTSSLSYSYTDANTQTGITQYRIQQVDLDGRVGYTDIRAIRGDGNLAKVVVYPNPSTDGKLNIVFEDNSTLRDVIVNDMQGKAIRSFRGISNNILVIEKLTTGFYTIKVTNRITNASSVHKVVIK
jgi:hypothetical protein